MFPPQIHPFLSFFIELPHLFSHPSPLDGFIFLGSTIADPLCKLKYIYLDNNRICAQTILLFFTLHMNSRLECLSLGSVLIGREQMPMVTRLRVRLFVLIKPLK